MTADRADISLDVTGLSCPLPVLRARKALGPLAPGAVLEVLASDPGSLEDFQAFCGLAGHSLIGQSSVSGVLRFLIKKGTPSPTDRACP
jgi:tRNA 2-thiouridine synthesizing protein A